MTQDALLSAAHRHRHASNQTGSDRNSTEVRLTQSEVAALLGATRQHVNRVLRELAGEGLVRQQYGSIEVLEPQRLLERAGVDVLGTTC